MMRSRTCRSARVRDITTHVDVMRWRQLSSHSFHPIVREFTEKLAKKQPAFAVSAERISVLSEPSEFYSLLLSMIERAQKRIFISSLYIGSEESALVDALRKALYTHPQLKVYLQLDLNRSTRPGPSSTARILVPLLKAHPNRVHVSMFRSPHLRGVMAKVVPPRFNEGWGTWHAKIYGADDEVVISGANLNKSYFTNRQDRYLHFANQPGLAQYCFEFLRTVSHFSFHLLPASSEKGRLGPHSCEGEHYTLAWSDPETHPHHIHDKARHAFSSFQAASRSASSLVTEDAAPSQGTLDHGKVLLFPVIQAGQFDIREEEWSLQLLFRHLQKMTPQMSRPLVDLTSGYFGLYETYRDLIRQSSNVDCRIVAASPKANGFYGSSGLSGRIPEGYTLLEQRFMKSIVEAGRNWIETDTGRCVGVQLSEWEKPGWTYHAKGIWLAPTHTSRPVLTLFGSTNLNSRSAHIDTELSFFMVIPSEDKATTESSGVVNLQDRLAGELLHIRENATPWKGARRIVRFWTKALVKVVQNML
ncbi:CDP-diacylglycerol-glycerol-3-phosphate 3-phosphatidyltransferase [Pluteus cervinus]|uniref:CDP-diacylglycerol-glycerol-3-phosphate 3-phosphatidyltransferase n=1 Tax=Pluteus cervinus TaxID=181527 RepID=A0ACD3AXF0_9AGAR|nr:CDP-diacylglycerol-glycerol-3-phosphate 3-phosphatidyltransferase [Pluteus cervinus]